VHLSGIKRRLSQPDVPPALLAVAKQYLAAALHGQCLAAGPVPCEMKREVAACKSNPTSATRSLKAFCQRHRKDKSWTQEARQQASNAQEGAEALYRCLLAHATQGHATLAGSTHRAHATRRAHAPLPCAAEMA
jgi:hypothetical protein